MTRLTISALTIGVIVLLLAGLRLNFPALFGVRPAFEIIDRQKLLQSLPGCTQGMRWNSCKEHLSQLGIQTNLVRGTDFLIDSYNVGHHADKGVCTIRIKVSNGTIEKFEVGIMGPM